METGNENNRSPRGGSIFGFDSNEIKQDRIIRRNSPLSRRSRYSAARNKAAMLIFTVTLFLLNTEYDGKNEKNQKTPDILSQEDVTGEKVASIQYVFPGFSAGPKKILC